ncbi:hypothetical protein BDY19DRAFT_966958 [Irpex rosettiformis]|uniref:Uncharacterized protein n=1 Tax=Irpex rosettiformis TaxID=378272 RepID=A0ACB8TT36_9APHY|nr:hypothetical protein BDY19DRAFT_966958 [Irpex rosettiformis]
MLAVIQPTFLPDSEARRGGEKSIRRVLSHDHQRREMSKNIFLVAVPCVEPPPVLTASTTIRIATGGSEQVDETAVMTGIFLTFLTFVCRLQGTGTSLLAMMCRSSIATLSRLSGGWLATISGLPGMAALATLKKYFRPICCNTYKSNRVVATHQTL